MTSTRSWTVLAGLLVLLGLSSQGRADDVILVPDSSIQAPGGRISGRIVSESPTSLRIEPTSGAAREIPIDQIASVNYTGQPASLPLAESREQGGALEEALDLYEKVVSEVGDRPLIAQRAQFGRARILADLAVSDPARAGEAIEALEAFVKEYPNSRHLGPALERLARLALDQEDLDRAGTAATRLKGISWAADRAAVLETRVQAARGQSDQALSALEALIGRAEPGSRVHNEARLTRAEILAEAGKYPEAESAVREVIASAPPEAVEIQAEAYNTLGDCLHAAGRPKDALFAYLHTEILYEADKQQHARALARIAALWRELRRDDRADDAVARLQQLYPQSPFLRDVQP